MQWFLPMGVYAGNIIDSCGCLLIELLPPPEFCTLHSCLESVIEEQGNVWVTDAYH